MRMPTPGPLLLRTLRLASSHPVANAQLNAAGARILDIIDPPSGFQT